jgi:hypothetical protein
MVQAGGQLIEADKHPLGVTVHQRQLTNLITWPFTGIAPDSLRDLVTARVRRGPAVAHPGRADALLRSPPGDCGHKPP